jgi:hypothetical protein
LAFNNSLHLLIRRNLVSSGSCGVQNCHFCRRIVQGDFPKPRSPVQGHAPSRSRQPGSAVSHRVEAFPPAQAAHESLLGGIFRVVMIPQHRVSNPVD